MSVVSSAMVDFVYDDDFVRLLFEDNSEVDFNKKFLPENIKAGDSVKIIISLDSTSKLFEKDYEVGGIQKTIRGIKWKDNY